MSFKLSNEMWKVNWSTEHKCGTKKMKPLTEIKSMTSGMSAGGHKVINLSSYVTGIFITLHLNASKKITNREWAGDN